MTQLLELVHQSQVLDLATQGDPTLQIKADDVKYILTDVDTNRRKRWTLLLWLASHCCFSLSALV